MIHSIVAPKDDQGWLRHLVEIQLALLKFAAAIPSEDAEDGFKETDLSRDLLLCADPEKAAKWLCERTKWIQHLKAFASHANVKEKEKLILDMRQDIELLDKLVGLSPVEWEDLGRSQNFIVASPQALTGASEFLIGFYEQWRSGFPYYLFNDRDANYKRSDYVTAFLEHNPQLHVCAICDETGYYSRAASHTSTSIEHFFPKSTFPHLSVHPGNLVPICSHCNLKASNKRRSTDDMNDGELMLPYGRKDRSIGSQSYIKIGSDIKVEGEKSCRLRIEILPAAGAVIAQGQIKAFEDTYAVQERWNASMERVESQLFRRIEHFLRPDIERNNDLTPDSLTLRLRLLMGLTASEMLGSDPYAFLMIWLLKHYRDSLVKDGEKSPVFIALKEWADSRRTHWKSMDDVIERLEQRIPRPDSPAAVE